MKLLFRILILLLCYNLRKHTLGEPQVIEPLPKLQNTILPINLKENSENFGDQKLAYYANWPDFVKSDSLKRYKETEIWHYVNVTPKLGFLILRMN
jgi:hypothetical protein